MHPDKFITSLPAGIRILAVVFLAFLAHFIVRELKRLSQWLLTLKLGDETASSESSSRRYPKIAGITTILVSALTFSIYFIAVGLILREFHVSLTAYLASASVIGLTLIFSDTLNIEDIVELSGQVGKVENIGLRFTTLVNFHGQKIYVPNRNIGMISRFRRGAIRAYVDIEIPLGVDEKELIEDVKSTALGLYSQHRSIILGQPELFGVKEAKGVTGDTFESNSDYGQARACS